MSETSIQEIRSLKVGRYIVIDGEPCKLVEYITSKPGKHGESKARMVAIGLFDKQKRSLVHPVKHKVHVPLVDRRKAQVLAMSGSGDLELPTKAALKKAGEQGRKSFQYGHSGLVWEALLRMLDRRDPSFRG